MMRLPSRTSTPDPEKSHLFFLAQVQEYGGDRAGALVSYSRLLGTVSPHFPDTVACS
jgi:hypothetical protein